MVVTPGDEKVNRPRYGWVPRSVQWFDDVASFFGAFGCRLGLCAKAAGSTEIDEWIDEKEGRWEESMDGAAEETRTENAARTFTQSVERACNQAVQEPPAQARGRSRHKLPLSRFVRDFV